MNKLSVPEELKDLSGAKLKEAMIKYRKEKIMAGILIFGVPPGEPISMPVPCEKTFVT